MTRKLKVTSSGMVLLAFLVLFIFGGIVVTQLFPIFGAQQKRIKSERFFLNIGEIRRAFDLKRAVDPAFDPAVDEYSPNASIAIVLKNLEGQNFLRNSELRDPSVPEFLWNTAPKFSWRISVNTVSNPSFEKTQPRESNEVMHSWVKCDTSRAASDSRFFPMESFLDDYPGQNKFGGFGNSKGSSLIIFSDNLSEEPGIRWPATGTEWVLAVNNASFTGRYSHSSVSFNGKIWLIGGTDQEFTNDVWSSPDGRTWYLETQGASFSPRCSHSSVVFNDMVWVIGGSAGILTKLNDVYNSSDGANWRLVTPTANFPAREGHTTLALYDLASSAVSMWVIGGQIDPLIFLNDVWKSQDGENWTEVSSDGFFPARSYHSSVVFKNKMWVIGGCFGVQQNDVLNDVWSSQNGVDWLLATDSAKFKARANHKSVVFEEKMWVIGGRGKDGELLNDVWWSTDGINWSLATETAAFSHRQNHSSVVFQNKMWVIGGDGGDSERNENDVWFSP